MKPAGASAWAPLASGVFRALWIAQLVSNTGTWMQTVGAQWILVGHSAALVTLVQTASSLPVVLLALPSGVLADRYDRRSVLVAAQLAMLAVATVLTVCAFEDALSAPLLLCLTFLLGCGTALMGPAWQAVQPELVEHDQLGAAAALGAVNMNLARAVGPALGGALVAAAGAGWVFAFNAVSYLGITVVLLRWERPREQRPVGGETLLAAVHAGRRYVWHAPGVRRVLLRTVLFIPGGAALWSLLPLVASHSLGLGSGGYGLLLGAVGLGAVSGAFALPVLRRVLGANGILAAGAALFAATLAVLAVTRSPWMAAAALLPAGLAWIGVLSTLNAAVQQRLPGWVRARGLAFYLVVFQGGQALTAPLWGALADGPGLAVALLTGAGLLLAAAVSVRRWPLRGTDGIDPTLSDHWPSPPLVFVPGPADGPVLVSLTYRVAPGERAAFTDCMRQLARSRRRTGALTWGLYQDGRDPGRFTENYLVASWSEHLAQHHSRLTATDRTVEERARRLLAPGTSPEVMHAFDASAGPVVTVTADREGAGTAEP
ncbi:putative MFS family arabinose efflux permease/quinol monooxygenase YgiN [Streptomyces sp. V3I8]|uniref:MFS transporter n=1 Tax=Streptomyces sp. V3I8 TaxID=3042279 RepID=UPI0027877CFB|nr:MFS transporter [Streptomyces sp. V3I8]MDQ1041204.1 putative MFS family arabinose efflux permease/quinol monooxygenase YgiN [Streptomyces sp. V3I8]